MREDGGILSGFLNQKIAPISPLSTFKESNGIVTRLGVDNT